jgi:tRNA(Ile)-lysidine synthase
MPPGDRVALAVSGGADSVAMFRLFLEVRQKRGLVLSVAHFNHRLRGRASDADEKFVSQLALSYDLPFYADRADVAAKALRERSNLEDAARRARYQFFSGLVNSGHATCVATAHTADDQAETVLAHLLRGTGIAGLSGIHPVSDRVIRPLLGFRRSELHSYLKELRQQWREDATNRDSHRTRARIRRQLVPLLEKSFQPLAVEHLAALASRARENETLLSALSAHVRTSCITSRDNGLLIGLRDLLAPFGLARPAELRALSGRLVLDLAAQSKPRPGQLNASHVLAVLQLAESGDPGKVLQLPGGLRVRREHDALLFFASAPSRR